MGKICAILLATLHRRPLAGTRAYIIFPGRGSAVTGSLRVCKHYNCLRHVDTICSGPHKVSSTQKPRHGILVPEGVRYEGRTPESSSRRGGILIGIGMDGFVDGIVFHRIAQWHNTPPNIVPLHTMDNMRVNITWDGLFHVLALLINSSLTEHRLT
jgi:hypothetical protein